MYEIGSTAVRFQIDYGIGTEMLQEYLKQYTKRDVISLKWVYFRLAELAEFQNQRVQAAIYYGEIKRIDPNWSGVSKKIKELSDCELHIRPPAVGIRQISTFAVRSPSE